MNDPLMFWTAREFEKVIDLKARLVQQWLTMYRLCKAAGVPLSERPGCGPYSAHQYLGFACREEAWRVQWVRRYADWRQRYQYDFV